MAYDVTQWLTEIRTLQRQVADLRRERDQANASLANWQRLYETEARQRRVEGEKLRSHIHALEAEIRHLKAAPLSAVGQPLPADLETVPLNAVELRERLQQAIAACQTLAHQLEAEQAAHARTRHTLTTALGETIDRYHPHPAGEFAQAAKTGISPS